MLSGSSSGCPPPLRVSPTRCSLAITPDDGRTPQAGDFRPSRTVFVAWIGALVRTVELTDKTWFVVLLVTGLLGVGLVGMIVYLIAAKEPDDGTPQPQRPAFAGTS